MNNSNSNNLVIEVLDLTKKFKDFTAINKINFKIYQGDIFGLIGPDGAGKTSTFHILGGISNISGGCVKIFNTNPQKAKARLSYLTQQFSLYTDLTVEENIDYIAKIKNIKSNRIADLKHKYLKLVDLEKFSNRLAGQLSGGMKQKLALCCGVISEPEILLLDEPTTGVDPISRRDFWDILASLADSGITIVVATPYLDEAERCNKVAFINQGNIVSYGSPEELKNSLNLHKIELIENSSVIANIISKLNHDDKVKNIKAFGDKLEVIANKNDLEKIADDLILTFNFDKNKFNILPINLDDVFNINLKNLNQNLNNYDYPFMKTSHNKVNPAIKANSLSKSFGNFKSVDNVNLEINYGQIYGLLGANGAGKTTTIKMLCGLLTPTSGNVILGNNTYSENILKQNIGYMSQKFVMYSDLTVLENLKYYLGVYNVPLDRHAIKLDWVIKEFNLIDELHTLTEKLPGGYKQKLSFAASILHEPDILFLDEPTSGIDPFMRQILWDYIRKIADNGTAILVTTHFIPEAENCHNLGFMVNGKLVATGSPTQIKQNQNLIELSVTDLSNAARILRKTYKPWQVSIFGVYIHLYLENIDDDSFKSRLQRENIAILSQRIIPYSLEDAFIKIIETNE